MKKKIKDLTLEECLKICGNHLAKRGFCSSGCPLLVSGCGCYRKEVQLKIALEEKGNEEVEVDE